jgi:hypothetical protein
MEMCLPAEGKLKDQVEDQGILPEACASFSFRGLTLLK